MLTNQFTSDNYRYTMNGWNPEFAIQETVDRHEKMLNDICNVLLIIVKNNYANKAKEAHTVKRDRRLKYLYRIDHVLGDLLDDINQGTPQDDCNMCVRNDKYSCNTIETIDELKDLIKRLIKIEENE